MKMYNFENSMFLKSELSEDNRKAWSAVRKRTESYGTHCNCNNSKNNNDGTTARMNATRTIFK